MRINRIVFYLFITVAILVISTTGVADALTARIQQDLITLGYQPGNTAGDLTVDTAIAISKFQAEHELEVSGEPTPQLAGILAAEIDKAGMPPATQSVTPVAAAPTPASGQQGSATSETDLQEAREACLQRKAEEAQQKQKTRRAITSLFNAAVRTSYRFGSPEVSRTVHDVYLADATARDVSRAAKDMGVTEEDIEACRNPG